MPSATALKVLIVDDKPAVRQVTRLALENIGVRLIHEAGNGSSGLQTAVVQPLDLIISEFSMPKMDGLQLLHAIRRHPAVRKLPFILITGRGDRELVVTAAQAGVNTYLIKPFTERTLLKKIEEVIGRLS
jgi:two-component system, chemotaxis family, chemotaxis protein CheY